MAYIKAISYYLPKRVITNEELVKEFPEWSVDKVAQKVGVDSRHLAAEDETAGDMAENYRCAGVWSGAGLRSAQGETRYADKPYIGAYRGECDADAPSTVASVSSRLRPQAAWRDLLAAGLPGC